MIESTVEISIDVATFVVQPKELSPEVHDVMGKQRPQWRENLLIWTIPMAVLLFSAVAAEPILGKH
jgi:hypothetical protein